MRASPEVLLKMQLETIRDALLIHYEAPDAFVDGLTSADFTLRYTLARTQHLLKMFDKYEVTLKSKKK